jgi:hypothetical protein
MSATPQSAVVWKDAKEELPDEDLTVLMALSDGEVWTGFLDAGEWRFVSADPVDQGDGTCVTHWADLPPHPNDQGHQSQPCVTGSSALEPADPCSRQEDGSWIPDRYHDCGHRRRCSGSKKRPTATTRAPTMTGTATSPHARPRNEKPAPSRGGSSLGGSICSRILSGAIDATPASVALDSTGKGSGNCLLCVKFAAPLAHKISDIEGERAVAGVVGVAFDECFSLFHQGGFCGIFPRGGGLGFAADFAAKAAQLDCCFVFHLGSKLSQPLGIAREKMRGVKNNFANTVIQQPRNLNR